MTNGEVVFSICDYSQEFIRRYKNPKLSQKVIDAIVVDFINYFAYCCCGMDLALYTIDLRDDKKMSEAGIVLQKETIVSMLNSCKCDYNEFGIMESVNRNSYMNECNGKATFDNGEALKVIETFIEQYESYDGTHIPEYHEYAGMKRFVDDITGIEYGIIKLKHSAIPKSVTVELLGQKLYPTGCNENGWPIFEQEVCYLFDWKEKSMKRIHGEDYKLSAEVTYDSSRKDASLREINSVKGITNAINDLKSLNQLIRDRRDYYDEAGGKKLKEYVIFGRYCLDKFGKVWTLEDKYNFPEMPTVCTLCQFHKKIHSLSEISWECLTIIPREGQQCPCCTKKFTIDDVKDYRCTIINGKIVHKECAFTYEENKEINEIIHSLMDCVYDEDDWSFDIIPNAATNSLSTPWFICHTPDGDIKVGKVHYTNRISIEWQNNFKPFDIHIFDNENATKWNRGIHAASRKQAYKYLKKVKDFVNSKP